MKKFLFSLISMLSGFIIASILSISLPVQSVATNNCADDCEFLCGEPGQVPCQGFACETGTVLCLKKDGDPGLPDTDL